LKQKQVFLQILQQLVQNLQKEKIVLVVIAKVEDQKDKTKLPTKKGK
jgi:hypothetical protein